MNSYVRGLCLSLLCALLGWVLYPTYPEFNYVKPKQVLGTYTSHSLVFELNVKELSDGYFRVIPDDCLSKLIINGKSYNKLPLPYCDLHLGRLLNLSEFLRVGTNHIEVEIYNTESTGDIAFNSGLNPWKVMLSSLLMGAALLNCVLLCIRTLPKTLSPAVFDKMKHVLIVIGALVMTYKLLVLSLYSERTSKVIFWEIAFLLIFILLSWTLPYRPVQRHSFSGIIRSKKSMLGMALIAVAYFLYTVFGTISIHYGLQTRAYDLGIQENLFWNSVQGDFFYSSVMANINYLGNHTSLIYLLFLPIYYVWPYTETLLTLQTALIVGAAIVLYFLASLMFRSFKIGALFGISFLFHTLIQGANFYDFHELAFGPVLIFSAILLLALGRLRAMWFTVILLLCVKEDASILVGCMGFGLFLMGNLRFGLQFICVGVAAYLFFQGTVVPAFAGESRSYIHYFVESFGGTQTPKDLVSVVSSDPITHIVRLMNSERLLYLVQAAGPLLFLPLLCLPGIAFCLYGLFLALYGGNSALYIQGFQYAFHFVSLMYVATVLFASSFLKKESFSESRTPFVLLCGAATAIMFLAYGMVYPAITFKGGFNTYNGMESIFAKREANSLLNEFVQNSKPVAASERLVPHLSKRSQIHTLRYISSGMYHQFNDFLVLSRDEKEFLDDARQNQLSLQQVKREGDIVWYKSVKIKGKQ